MSDASYFERSQIAFLTEMRMGFLAAPRMVTKRKADHHASMAETWVEHAHRCGRPSYREAPGFTPSRYRTAGIERPYGWESRAFWRYVWLAMKSAFLSAVDDSTYETPADGGRSHTIITGITS